MALNILFWFLAVEQKYYDLPLVLYEGHHTVPALFIPDTFLFSAERNFQFLHCSTLLPPLYLRLLSPLPPFFP